MLNLMVGAIVGSALSVVGNIGFLCTRFKTWLPLQVPAVAFGIYTITAVRLPYFMMVQYDASEQRTYKIIAGLAVYAVLSCATYSLYAKVATVKASESNICKTVYNNTIDDADTSSCGNDYYDSAQQEQQLIRIANIAEREIVETFVNGVPVKTTKEKVINYV